MSLIIEPLVSAELPPVGVAKVADFVVAIEKVRNNLKRDEWREFCKSDILLKQWVTLLSEEPYTRRALEKPRGYAGDAVMMDLAYNHPSCATTIAASSLIGQDIYHIVVQAAMSVSVRERIKLIAHEIANASTSASIKIGSFASGHGRELEKLNDHCRRNIETFYAIDSDELSLTALQYDNGDSIAVSPLKRNVFRLKAGDLPPLNLAYSLGLFDYLEAKAAGRLVSIMAGMVASGGRLIIGNLSDGAGNLAYCEAVMDWWMITRSESEMANLANSLPDRSSWNVTIRNKGCFNYLIADHVA